MRSFDYTRPQTIDETLDLLDGDVRPLAGGTDLLTLMKADVVTPRKLVDVKRLSDLPGGIEETDDGVRLGALTTLSEIEHSDLLRARMPALSQAAGLAATPQLRNMATLGGNLLQRPRCWYYRSQQIRCWLQGGDECQARDGQNQFHALFGDSPCVAVHPSDLANALLALDAEVTVRGAEGARTLPLSDFFALPTEERRTENVMASDELLHSVRIPRRSGDVRSIYLKAMDRKVWAFALVGVAAVVQMDGGAIQDARLVLSGVAPIPWRVEAAEQEMRGATPDARLFDRIAEVALAGAEPLEHNGYKVPLAKRLVRRALQETTNHQ